jgi:hypothetical protein
LAAALLDAMLLVKTRQPGVIINRKIYGQFSEHLRTPHLLGRLRGRRQPDSQHARHPQRRRGCAVSVEVSSSGSGTHEASVSSSKKVSIRFAPIANSGIP